MTILSNVRNNEAVCSLLTGTQVKRGQFKGCRGRRWTGCICGTELSALRSFREISTIVIYVMAYIYCTSVSTGRMPSKSWLSFEIHNSPVGCVLCGCPNRDRGLIWWTLSLCPNGLAYKAAGLFEGQVTNWRSVVFGCSVHAAFGWR